LLDRKISHHYFWGVNLELLSPPIRFCRREISFWACLSAIFIAVNLLTGTRFPTVWQDESLYTDPAANAYFGHGFTSSAFPAQPYGTFWAGNVPLPEFLLTAWFHIFGFSLLSARAMNYLLITVTMWVLWIGFKKSGLIRTTAFGLGAAFVMLCTAGITMNYRSARPDCVPILVASLAFLAFTVSSGVRRRFFLLLLGFFFPWAGLQLAVFAGIFALIFLIFTRGRHLGDFLFLGMGVALGAGALVVFFAAHGVLHNFIAGVVQYNDIGVPHKSLFQRVTGLPRTLLEDKTQTGCAVVALGWLGLKHFGKIDGPTKWLRFAAVAWVFVPAAMGTLAKFPVYYAWMTIIPLVICLASCLEQGWQTNGTRRYCRLAMALLAVCVSIGLPLKLAVTALRWHSRDYAAVQNYVNPWLGHSQWFFTDNVAYFAVKSPTNVVVLKSYLETITPEEKSRIRIAVIRPQSAADLPQLLGGSWKPVAPPLVSQWNATRDSNPIIRKAARRMIKSAQDEDWQIGIFERSL
jgi:hypothetical protein